MLVGGRGTEVRWVIHVSPWQHMLVHSHVPVVTYVVAFPAQLMDTTAMEKAASLSKPANLVDVRLVDELTTLPAPIRVMV